MNTNELELIQTTRIRKDFMEKLPVALSVLAEPFQKIVAASKKMRIVIDYDPNDQKVEFKYLVPPEYCTSESR